MFFDGCNLGPFTTSENQRATNATGNNLYFNADRIEQKQDRTEKRHFFRTFDCDTQIRLNFKFESDIDSFKLRSKTFIALKFTVQLLPRCNRTSERHLV